MNIDIIESLRKKLSEFFEKKELSQNEVAQKLGIEQASLSRFVNGKQSISGENFVKLFTFLDGEMRFPPHLPTIHRIGAHAPVEEVTGDVLPLIPVFLEAGAGPPVEFWRTEPEISIPVLPQYFRSDIRAIEVIGDSMEPTIKKGAIVGVIPLAGTLVDGGIYLVRLPFFGLVVKRVRSDASGGLCLISDNQNYPPRQIPNEGFSDIIVGQVIWVWQSC